MQETFGQSESVPAAVSASRLVWLILCWAFVLLIPVAAQQDYRYESSGKELTLRSSEEFQKTINPHAILSLQSPDESVILVTTEEEKFTIDQLYDGLPSTFDDGAECVGRVLLAVDGEDAATFLVEGLFPPDGSDTHNTLYAVTNHDRTQYTIMIHYPKDRGDEGFEWAASLLGSFTWTKDPTR